MGTYFLGRDSWRILNIHPTGTDHDHVFSILVPISAEGLGASIIQYLRISLDAISMSDLSAW